MQSIGYYAIVFGGVIGIGALATIGTAEQDGDVGMGCAMSLILATLTVAITFVVDLAGGLS